MIKKKKNFRAKWRIIMGGHQSNNEISHCITKKKMKRCHLDEKTTMMIGNGDGAYKSDTYDYALDTDYPE